MRPVNPYGDLASLVDTTRALNPEEIAELHLEQGFVERALAIYEQLAEERPEAAYLAQRRDWLRRLAGLPVELPGGGTLRGFPSPAKRRLRPPARARARMPTPRPVHVRRLAIIGVD